MPNNWCRNVVLLYKRDIHTGAKEVDEVFASLVSAKKYRRRYADEALKQGLNLSDMYPIEKRRVKIQSEV